MADGSMLPGELASGDGDATCQIPKPRSCIPFRRSDFHAVDAHVRQRLSRWLCGKHKVPGPGGDTYSLDYLYHVLGLVSLERMAPRRGAA